MLRGFDDCKSEALAHLPLGVRIEEVPLRDALNRILALEVVSPNNIPAFPTSIKDGYAVRSEDLLTTNRVFPIEFAVRSGNSEANSLSPLHVAYITTGSVLPKGADAVVEVECTSKVDDSHVSIHCVVAKGTDVRQVGSDLRKGELLVRRGTCLGPPELGALASVGMWTQIGVFSRPIVGVLATGDELAGEHEVQDLPRGHVFDCNRPMLLGALQEAGCVGVDLGVLPDSLAKERLPGIVNSAFESVDLLITTGGVSKGDSDCIRLFLEEEKSFTTLFLRVNIKPGKPVTCALRGNQVMFSLPGNPVSALVMFHTLVLPCLRKMAGYAQLESAEVFSITERDIVLDVRPEFQRVQLHSNAAQQLVCLPTGFQRSSRVASLLNCDALVSLPSSTSVSGGVLQKGSVVSTVVFSDWRRGLSAPPLSSPDVALFPPLRLVSRPPPTTDFEVMVIYVQDHLDGSFAHASRDAKAIQEAVSVDVRHKTIPKDELHRVLRDTVDSVVFVTSTKGLLWFCQQAIRSNSIRMIPGISQLIRESCSVWNEITVGVASGGSIVVDLSAVRLSSEISPLVTSCWMLLKVAMTQI